MPRALLVRRPTRREVRRLHDLLAGDLAPGPRRRAEAVLLHAAGLDARMIASALGVHPNTVYADLHAFGAAGLACLTAGRRRGAPARLTAAQRAAILAVADRPPTEFGLPYGRWSLATLRAHLLARRVVRAISREHLRRVLQRGGSASAASSAGSRALTRSGRRS
jgi:transposase